MTIAVLEKTQCCGCAACASACPAKCIELKADEEGFLYPVVDEFRCILCNLCERVCPVIQREPEIARLQRAYLVQHKNPEVLIRSTSGGAFTAIAEYVVSRGGAVFGASLDARSGVKHVLATTTEDLEALRGSKYVQSAIGDSFRVAQAVLDERRLVCFSGTPCQIEGLQCYLRKDYSNLLKVDVVCHAVPSPLVLQRYLSWQSARLGIEIKDVAFRDKLRFGYKYSSMSIYSDASRAESVYARGVETDPYLRAFFSNVCDRPSCYNCAFKKRYRVSDLTLWDCFEADLLASGFEKDAGVTRVLVQSEKGAAVMQHVARSAKFVEIDVDKAIAGVREMSNSVPLNERRAQFFDDCRTLSDDALFSKWFPDTTRVKLERMARLGLARLGLYQPAKRLAKRLLGR